MECRSACGACCIALSISSRIPGMPEGKPGGVKCVNLTDTFACSVYEDRPQVCRNFSASAEYCGTTRIAAMNILTELERKTLPLNYKYVAAPKKRGFQYSEERLCTSTDFPEDGA